MLNGMWTFAWCMRSHGVPNWPDPTTDDQGRTMFDIHNIDPDSPRISTAIQEWVLRPNV